jgi:TetR/AcrR family transcriptional regulator, transcriptional repressor of bet genes
VPTTERHDERRDQLAESALRTLGERGYARTSLRDIAQNSPFSHGVVHYYFSDKTDLVLHSVRHYKARCVHRYDSVVVGSRSPEELVEAFVARLGETIRDEAPMHRLWYDLRTQSMFDSDLREAVRQIDAALEAMVWRIVERYAVLAGRAPATDPVTAYGVLDGLFQLALLDHLDTGEPALARLAEQVRRTMPLLLAGGAAPHAPGS